MMLRPCASSARALARTSKADSVPRRDMRAASGEASSIDRSYRPPLGQSISRSRSPRSHGPRRRHLVGSRAMVVEPGDERYLPPERPARRAGQEPSARLTLDAYVRLRKELERLETE